MSSFEEIMGEIRLHDLDDFRKKMETMEAAKKMEIEAQGFETFDSILERRSESRIPGSEDREQQKETSVPAETTTDGEKSDGEVFSRFLQTIRG